MMENRMMNKFWAEFKYSHNLKIQCQHMGAALFLFYGDDETIEQYNPIYPLRGEFEEV